MSQEILAALRIVAAFMFMQHGMVKLFGFPTAFSDGEVQLYSLIGAAGVLEMFGGLLLLIGLFTRPVALVLSGEMAVGYFMAHASHGFWTVANGGDAAVL
jgi:putative oxidoreductase